MSLRRSGAFEGRHSGVERCVAIWVSREEEGGGQGEVIGVCVVALIFPAASDRGRRSMCCSWAGGGNPYLFPWLMYDHGYFYVAQSTLHYIRERQNKDRARSKVVQRARRLLRTPQADQEETDSPTAGCYRHRTPSSWKWHCGQRFPSVSSRCCLPWSLLTCQFARPPARWLTLP